MRQLSQSTTANVMVFMTDSTDHVSGKTGLTLTITASKDGAAFASITPTVTERGNGWYNLALTTAHTDTLGDLAIRATSTGADPTDLVMFIGLAASVWSVNGLLNKTYAIMMAEMNAAAIIRLGQCQAGSTTQAIVLDASASAVNDFYNRTTITFVTGVAAGQNRLINDYNGATKTAYLDRPLLTSAPGSGDYFAIDSRGNVRAATDLRIGLAQGGAAGSITLQADETGGDDFFNRMFVLIESGTGEGQARLIDDYNGTSKVALVARNWIVNPDNTSRYVIIPFGSVKVSQLDDDVITAASIATDAITEIQGNLAKGITKNVAMNNFMFMMLDSSDHVTPIATRTVTAQRSLDGGAFAACANSVTEVSNGMYRINLAATDLNADIVTLRFTATGADATLITIITEP